MIRVRLAAFAAALAICAPATPTLAAPAGVAFPHEHSDIQPSPDIRFGRLANGLGYIIERDPQPAHTAYVQLRLASGYLNEAEDEQGLSGMVMRLALEGSTHIEGPLMSWLQARKLDMSLGMMTNVGMVDTTYTVTAHDLSDPAAADSLFALREVASELTFPADDLARVREITAQQTKTQDLPQTAAFHRLQGDVFTGQAIATRTLFGSADVLNYTQPDKIKAFYHGHYRPDQATLIVVGDIDLEKVEARIKSGFADWQARADATPVADPGIYRAAGRTVSIETAPGMPETISFLWLRPIDPQPANTAALEAAMSRRFGVNVLNSRLQRIAAATDGHFSNPVVWESDLPGTARAFGVTIMPKSGETEAALTQVTAALHQFSTFGVTDGELQVTLAESRNAARTDVNQPLPAQPELGRLDFMLQQKLPMTSPTQDYDRRMALLAHTTADTVNAAVKPLWTWDGPRITLTGAGTGGLTAERVRADYDTEIATAVTSPSASGVKAWPYTDFGPPSAVVKREQIDALGVTHLTYANGLQVYIQPRHDVKDQVVVQFEIAGGWRKFAVKPAPTFILGLGAFYEGGLRRISHLDMHDALAGRNYTLSAGVSDLSTFLFGTTTPADLQLQLQMLMAYATDYHLEGDSFANAKSSLPAYYANITHSPEAMLQIQRNRLIHNGDPRYTVLSQEDADRLSQADAQSVLDVALSPGPSSLSIVGDIDPAQAEAMVDKTFAALSPRPATVPVAPGGGVMPFPTGVDKVFHYNAPDGQGMDFLAWPTTDYGSDPRRSAAIQVLTHILNRRFFAADHVAFGLTNEDAFKTTQSNGYKGFGYIYVESASNEDATSTFAQTAQPFFDALAQTPVTADELAEAKTYLETHIDAARNGNVQWAHLLCDLSYPWGKDEVINAKTLVDSVDAGLVQDVAKAYLRPDKQFHLMIVPGQVSGGRAS